MLHVKRFRVGKTKSTLFLCVSICNMKTSHEKVDPKKVSAGNELKSPKSVKEKNLKNQEAVKGSNLTSEEVIYIAKQMYLLGLQSEDCALSEGYTVDVSRVSDLMSTIEDLLLIIKNRELFLMDILKKE